MTDYTSNGAKILLYGPSGTGKTHSLETLVEAGITPFILFTENGMATLEKFAGKPPDCKIHWHYIRPANASWSTLIDNAKKVRDFKTSVLQEMPGINKRDYDQILDLLETCNNFKCDRCGREFGDAETWGTDRALVLDSLSGMNKLEMNLQVGAKPVRSQPDWGVAMDNQLQHLTKMVGLRCHFVLIGHVERIVNEVSGGYLVVPMALGKKNAPKIPLEFDEVILSVREGKQFSWSTAESGADLKVRLMPIEDKLEPTFVPLIEAWKESGGVIQPTEEGVEVN